MRSAAAAPLLCIVDCLLEFGPQVPTETWWLGRFGGVGCGSLGGEEEMKHWEGGVGSERVNSRNTRVVRSFDFFDGFVKQERC